MKLPIKHKACGQVAMWWVADRHPFPYENPRSADIMYLDGTRPKDGDLLPICPHCGIHTTRSTLERYTINKSGEIVPLSPPTFHIAAPALKLPWLEKNVRTSAIDEMKEKFMETVEPLGFRGWNFTPLQIFGMGPKWAITCGKCRCTFEKRIPMTHTPGIACPHCNVVNVLPITV